MSDPSIFLRSAQANSNRRMHIVKRVAMGPRTKASPNAAMAAHPPSRRRPQRELQRRDPAAGEEQGGELKSGALPIRPLPHAPCSFLNTRVRIFRDGTPFGRKLIGRHHEFVIKNNGRIGALPFSAPATEVRGPRA
jgi:hypothetical protein